MLKLFRECRSLWLRIRKLNYWNWICLHPLYTSAFTVEHLFLTQTLWVQKCSERSAWHFDINQWKIVISGSVETSFKQNLLKEQINCVLRSIQFVNSTTNSRKEKNSIDFPYIRLGRIRLITSQNIFKVLKVKHCMKTSELLPQFQS